MKILIQSAHIIDRGSSHNGTVRDILIENGVITAIGDGLHAEGAVVVRHEGLCVSPGWVDIFSHFNDPGYEFKETLETGAAAAAAGGYTDVFVLPNTKPVVDSKTQVEYIRRGSGALPVTVWPIGAMTRGLEGKDLAEMYDMRNSGAVAFSDGTSPVQSAGLLLKGLQYVKAFGGTVIQIPDDTTVGAGGLMNEGVVSTRLGLPGKPMMAEELMVAGDIKLVRYTESKIQLYRSNLSAQSGVYPSGEGVGSGRELFGDALSSFFADADLVNYDTNLKVYPPLRDKSSVELLRKAVAGGLVDCIASHHLPHEFDSKVLEFEYAKKGMIGLETAYPVLRTVLPSLSSEAIVDLLSYRPRSLFGLEQPRIHEGHPSVLTLFNPGDRRGRKKRVRGRSRRTVLSSERRYRGKW
ncbi:dihydroorotase [Puia sp. P3]|uniref:dihydroorotase n=1 Tax=Puia sp. P3 TaxID=3423952 RepID=UPI003D671728